MKKQMTDFDLAKISLAKKVTELCVQFMRDNDAENIDLEVVSQDPELTTGFDTGKTICGRVLSVKVDTWNDEDDDD